jgi:hypothetical protein
MIYHQDMAFVIITMLVMNTQKDYFYSIKES